MNSIEGFAFRSDEGHHLTDCRRDCDESAGH